MFEFFLVVDFLFFCGQDVDAFFFIQRHQVVVEAIVVGIVGVVFSTGKSVFETVEGTTNTPLLGGSVGGVGEGISGLGSEIGGLESCLFFVNE